MAGTPPNDPQTPWGNVPPPNYFQQPPSNASNLNASGNHHGSPVSFEVVARAWQMITSDQSTWLLASLVAIVIYYGIIAAVFGPYYYVLYQQFNQSISSGLPVRNGSGSSSLIPFGIGILLSGVAVVLDVGIAEMALRRLEGRAISVGDVFLGFKRFVPVFGVGVTRGLISNVGRILLLVMRLFLTNAGARSLATYGLYAWYIPEFFIMGLLSLAPLLIIRGRARGIEAIGMSFNLLRDHWLMAGVLYFCLSLLVAVGACACCIGIIWTFPLLPVAVGLIYANFFPPSVGASRQEGPSNYYRP